MEPAFEPSVGLSGTLGITFEELGAERVVAAMPVTPRHLQPLGYLHGGASVALAETAASVGATTGLLPDSVAFGLEINANHVRPVRGGTLRAYATRLHAGRTTQVWEVLIRDQEDRLVCISRCTLAVVPAERSGGSA